VNRWSIDRSAIGVYQMPPGGSHRPIFTFVNLTQRRTMPCDPATLFAVHGRVAVVTGGGGALCGTMARALAEAGAAVAVLDRDPVKAGAVVAEIVAGGGTALAFAVDVLDPAALGEVEREVVRSLGPPAFLVNGAGGNDPRGSTGVEFAAAALPDGERTFFDLEPAGVRETVDLNFLGTLLPTQVFARGMAARGAGAVLNLASMSALTPLTKVGPYSAAKAAVANLTRWLAVHLARTGVRVNALAPGFVMTEQLRFLHRDPATGEPTARSRQVVAHTPMGRYGEPEDLLGAMFWLLSDASRFVTGTVVAIDGGFSSYSC
jgi:NAD(P)-dependent dehydrogenase (short-subunit alcohol dehydrogenase family)